MDGLSALSVAASVAQFIEFGCSLVSKSKEIYKSGHGASKQHVESAAAAQRIIELSEGMKTSLQLRRTARVTISEQQQSLEAICDGCITVSAELLARLDKLKVRDSQKNRRWKSFRHALKSVWSKSAIDEIAMRLENFKKELDGHVLVSLSQKFHNLSILQDQSFTSLDATLQQNIEILLFRLVDMHNKVDEVLATQKKYLGTSTEGLVLDREAQKRVGDSMVNIFILGSLRFPSISHREDAICEAHRTTCSWIFQRPPDHTVDSRPWSNFVEWLLNDGSIYWINGKAGSGKSTLMKYIHHSPDTMRHLKSWAGDAELQVANYYFWNGGSVDQRSYAGLLRSLLYKILNSQKDLIRHIFPDEWHETRLLVDRIKAFEEPPSWSWSFNRLEKALTDLEIAFTDRFKLCLFIDGLDEYEGDLDTVIGILQRLSMSPYVKVCLSSRPWLIFEEAFSHNPGLQLQTLTCDDIRAYVRDKLDKNQKMQQLINSDPVRAITFSRTIISKANGVFLWVRLVIASLLNGLRNRDEMSDLQKRLELIPSELDDLYSHMLGRIEPMYLQQASQIFEIFNSATDLSLRLTVLELELAVSSSFDEAMLPPGNPMSDEEIESRCLRMRAVLKSRCEGLLETHDHMDRNWEAVDGSVTYSATSKDAVNRSADSAAVARKLMVDWKVSYLHRTVKDYLRSKGIRAKLQEEATGTNSFDPNLSLLQSYVINLKRSICSYYFDAPGSHEMMVWRTADDAFLIASLADRTSMATCLTLLRELSIASTHWFCRTTRPLFPPATGNFYITNVPLTGQRRFLLLAVRTNRESYVRNWLEDYATSIPRFHEQLLECALQLRVDLLDSSLYIGSSVYPSMVKLLLQHGADPNATCSHHAPETIWQRFVWSLRMKNTHWRHHFEAKEEALILEALLKSGADPQAIVSSPEKSDSASSKQPAKLQTAAAVLRELFAKTERLVDEGALLSAILDEPESGNQAKGKRQSGKVPSSGKEKQGKSKKRPLVSDRGNVTSDDESARRPLKRRCRRGK